MHHLKITKRISISILFLLLSLGFLFNAYITSISANIDRARLEQEGTRYLRLLMQVLDAVIRHYTADLQGDAALYAISNQFHLRRAALLSPEQLLLLPELHLSPREKEILLWCSQGKSNSVIAAILSISEKTIEFHLNSVFKKLEVSGRTMAVLKAVNLKLINA